MWEQRETMECPNCKEISYVHVDTEVFHNYKTLEYNCTECPAFGYFDEKKEVIDGAALVIEKQMKIIDKLEERLADAEFERDLYWEVRLAAGDVRDLDEMTGVPMRRDSRRKAEDSLNQLLAECDEWEMDL